ncbi:MAG: DUF1573 domain-containing protein [Bacteroidota bacterium]
MTALGMLSGPFAWTQGKVRFPEKSKYLGDINEADGKVEAIFPFENIGRGPVVLEQVKASCGCTSPIYTRDTVAAGSQGFVKVVFNPLGRPGAFKKQIVVTTNGTTKYHSLTISGKVIPRPKGPQDFYPFAEGNLRFKTNHFTYGRLYKDQSATLSTVMYNDGDRPIRFNRGKSVIPRHLKPEITTGKIAPGDTVHLRLTYDAAKKDDWGFCFENIFLATDDRDRPMKRLNVSVDLRERFPKNSGERAQMGHLLLDRATHDFGRLAEGEPAITTFRLTNNGKGDLHLRKASSGCTCIEIEPLAEVVSPGESTEMRVIFATQGRVGREEKEVVLISSDPNHPIRILKIGATIVRAK